MTTDEMVRFDLSDGPSNHLLVDAFKYSYDRHTPHSVPFTLRNGCRILVQITSIRHLDNTNMHFSVEGYIRNIYIGGNKYSISSEVGCWVTLDIDCRNKSGYVEIEDNECANLIRSAA